MIVQTTANMTATELKIGDVFFLEKGILGKIYKTEPEIVYMSLHNDDLGVLERSQLVRKITEDEVPSFQGYLLKKFRGEAEVALEKTKHLIPLKATEKMKARLTKSLEKKPAGILSFEKILAEIIPKAEKATYLRLSERMRNETLANMERKANGKPEYPLEGKKQWESFFSNRFLDTANELYAQIIASQFEQSQQHLWGEENAYTQLLQASSRFVKELESMERNRLLDWRKSFHHFLANATTQNQQTTVELAVDFDELVEAIKSQTPVKWSKSFYNEMYRWAYLTMNKDDEEMVQNSYNDQFRMNMELMRRGKPITKEVNAMEYIVFQVDQNPYASDRLAEAKIFETDKTLQAYLDQFTMENIYKLSNALQKHIKPTMKLVSTPLFHKGNKGLEVIAAIQTEDGTVKNFHARSIFAGGMIQRFHARYITSFKN